MIINIQIIFHCFEALVRNPSRSVGESTVNAILMNDQCVDCRNETKNKLATPDN